MAKGNKQGKTCLVIGANSFVGHHLIHYLKAAEAAVTGAFHRQQDKLFPDVRNVPIAELSQLEEPFDEVYLVSAYIPSGKTDAAAREKMFEANVALVDEICSRYGNSRIVYCSSVSVYRIKEGTITENDGEGALNEYGVSKLWGERIVAGHPSHAIVRLSSVYGVGMQQGTIIPRYIQQALDTGEVTVFGKGERLQDYIHVRDVAGFLAHAGSYEGNEKFLACSAQRTSNLDLAEAVAKQLNSRIVFKGEDPSPSFVYNNQHTKNILGYEPVVAIQDGINEVIKWIEKKS